MCKTRLALVSSLALTLATGVAWAQMPEPTTPETAPPATTAPMDAPPPATLPPPAEPTAPAAEMGPAPGAPAAPVEQPMPAEEEETFPPAWFRIDSDLAGVQLWAGATHMLSDSVGIATDMYVNAFVNTPQLLGEFDIGPSFVAGPVYITPMLGLQADWALRELVAFVPQLYITGGPDPIYMELWVQNYQYNVFDDTNGANTLYFRFFVDLKLGKYLAIGPEIEATLALNSSAEALFASGETLGSLPIGANIMLPNYGKGNNFFIFAGYETQDTPNDSHLAGRLTFVRNF